MIEFYSSHMLARHVSDINGLSSGAFFYKLYVQIWYVVIRVLLDTSSRYGWTCRVVCTVVPHTESAHTACKQNAPEDGPLRSETFRANISAE